MRFQSEAMYTSSRWCSSEDPPNHGMLSLRSTTLSPFSAETGMNVRSPTSSFRAKSRNSDLIDSKTFSS